MKPGLYDSVDELDYHASDDSLSASQAKVLLGRRAPTSTDDALTFGTLAHAVLLEPDKAVRDYVVLDPNEIGVLKDGSPAANPTSTVAWKQAVADVTASGVKWVSPANWQRAHDMAEAVHSHKRAAEILAQCPRREVSAFAEFQGVTIRGRFDLLGDNLLSDFKTCLDADPERFGRDAHLRGYHISAAAYLLIAELLGLNIPTFEFINVEKLPTPGGNYRVSVVQLDDMYIAQGRADFVEAVRRWIALGKRVDLPNWPDDAVLVGIPDYLIDDEMEMAN